MLTNPNADPYASKVLDPAQHNRLVADIDRYAATAAVQKHWIWTPLKDYCGQDEVEYLRAFRRHKTEAVNGLVYIGGSTVKASDKMSAIVGLLIRNFIDARMVLLGQLLSDLEEGNYPEGTCVCVPNFFVPSTSGGHLAPWQISRLHDWLLARHNAGLQTVLYVYDMKVLGAEYGPNVRALIDAGFVQVKNG